MSDDRAGELFAPIHEALAERLGKTAAARYIREEAAAVAVRLATIEREREAGGLTEEEAAALLKMQTDSSAATLAAVEGVGRIEAQNAINAALEAVRAVVVKAAGAIL